MTFWWFMMMHHIFLMIYDVFLMIYDDVPWCSHFLVEFFHSELLVFQRALHFLIVLQDPRSMPEMKWTMKCADYESIQFFQGDKMRYAWFFIGFTTSHESHQSIWSTQMKQPLNQITCGSGLIFYRPTLQDFQYSNMWHFTTYKIYIDLGTSSTTLSDLHGDGSINGEHLNPFFRPKNGEHRSI